MSSKDFILKFFLAVTGFLSLILVFTYLDIKKYGSDNFLEKAGSLPGSPPSKNESSLPDNQKTAQDSSSGQPVAEGEDSQAPVIDANLYSRKEYPLRRGETGSFKSASDDKIVINVGGKDYNVITTPTTEIFYNGSRVTLSDIKENDLVMVSGREKTEGSDSFIGDSIYVFPPQPSIIQ